MPPRALSFPAPSRSLLRYLRAQSEGLTYLESGNGASCTSFGDPFRCPLRGSSARAKQSSRALCTSKPRRMSADLQAGILNIDAILPKFLRKPRRTATVSEAQVLAASRRYASDDHTPSVLCKPSWQERIFGSQASRSASKAAARAAKFSQEDMPGQGPGHIFSASRTQAAKAALEPRLRCTEVDENGEVIMVDGEFKKSELIAKVGNKRCWWFFRPACSYVSALVRVATTRSPKD
jgi:magnesium transporter